MNIGDRVRHKITDMVGTVIEVRKTDSLVDWDDRNWGSVQALNSNLEVIVEKKTFKKGDRVKRDCWTGTVHGVGPDLLCVYCDQTQDYCAWYQKNAEHLVEFKPGDLVRIKASVTKPWGGWFLDYDMHKIVGIWQAKAPSGPEHVSVVDFPSHPGYHVLTSELEAV